MQKKDTGHIYAMKILRKADMLEKEQVKYFVSTTVFQAYCQSCCSHALVLRVPYVIYRLPAGCPYPGREGHSGGGGRCLGGQDVLQLPGQEEPLPHHGVPAWRFALITSV